MACASFSNSQNTQAGIWAWGCRLPGGNQPFELFILFSVLGIILKIRGEGFHFCAAMYEALSNFSVTEGEGVRKPPNLHDVIYEWPFNHSCYFRCPTFQLLCPKRWNMRKMLPETFTFLEGSTRQSVLLFWSLMIQIRIGELNDNYKTRSHQKQMFFISLFMYWFHSNSFSCIQLYDRQLDSNAIQVEVCFNRSSVREVPSCSW